MNRNAYFKTDISTREAESGSDKYIEGYFIVYNRETKLWDGFFEQIAPGALDNSLKNNDIRVLFNHNSDIVLGRKSANTATFRTDDKGLFVSVKINTKDSQAMDIYARVQRGDISGCSFGFNPVSEKYEQCSDGEHCTVIEADTLEVSVCPFPAYPQTEISARHKERSIASIQTIKQRKKNLKRKLEEIKC